jgi:hypothetical protein
MTNPETGELMEASVPVSREITEQVPVLPERIDAVLERYKAGPNSKGTRAISGGGVKAINHIKEMAAGAQTIDDLVNVRREVRRLKEGGGVEGAQFDNDLDDKALAEVMDAVRDIEKESIRKAAPRRAAKIIGLIDANNRLYGETLAKLRKGEMRFAATQNSESIISKVKLMGPEEARALMGEMMTNEALGPYVKELQNAFLDDLLLSGVKNGEFSSDAMAKTWRGVSKELKSAWLPAEVVQQMDAAITKGTEPIPDPEMVGKALFGKDADFFLGEKKLQHIGAETRKKELAELRALDAVFGSDYLKRAIKAYRQVRTEDPKLVGTDLFGQAMDKFLAMKRISNIGSEAQEKSLAALRQIDQDLGTSFTEEATNAYKARQLQVTKDGKIPTVNNISTGKSDKLARKWGARGAVAGSVVPVAGTMIGLQAGQNFGEFLQSPAGAIWAFSTLNRLESKARSATSKATRETAKKLVNQGARSGIFGGDDDDE